MPMDKRDGREGCATHDLHGVVHPDQILSEPKSGIGDEAEGSSGGAGLFSASNSAP